MPEFEKSYITGAQCVYLNHQGLIEFKLENGKVATVECEVSDPDVIGKEDLGEPSLPVEKVPVAEEPEPLATEQTTGDEGEGQRQPTTSETESPETEGDKVATETSE